MPTTMTDTRTRPVFSPAAARRRLLQRLRSGHPLPWAEALVVMGGPEAGRAWLKPILVEQLQLWLATGCIGETTSPDGGSLLVFAE